MNFSLCLEGWVCIIRFKCEKNELRVINSPNLKNLKHKHNNTNSTLFFLSKKTHYLKSWELGFLVQRKSFSPLFSVHWLSLCVVNTSPTSFIFHFCFSLGHLWGFYGKRLAFEFESNCGLVLDMDNAVVWIANVVEENFHLRPKVPPFFLFFITK